MLFTILLCIQCVLYDYIFLSIQTSVYSRGIAGVQNTVNSSFYEKSQNCYSSKLYITNITYIIMIYLARELRVESINSDVLRPYNIILLLYIMTRSFHTLTRTYTAMMTESCTLHTYANWYHAIYIYKYNVYFSKNY